MGMLLGVIFISRVAVTAYEHRLIQLFVYHVGERVDLVVALSDGGTVVDKIVSGIWRCKSYIGTTKHSHKHSRHI